MKHILLILIVITIWMCVWEILSTLVIYFAPAPIQSIAVYTVLLFIVLAVVAATPSLRARIGNIDCH